MKSPPSPHPLTDSEQVLSPLASDGEGSGQGARTADLCWRGTFGRSSLRSSSSMLCSLHGSRREAARQQGALNLRRPGPVAVKLIKLPRCRARWVMCWKWPPS